MAVDLSQGGNAAGSDVGRDVRRSSIARRNKLKLLIWERNGFIVWYKRLERHRFHWPRRSSRRRC